MVAPLIARGGARVLSKATRQSSTVDRTGRSQKGMNAKRLDNVDTPGPTNGINTKLLAEARSLNKTTTEETSSLRKIRVVTASTLISWSILPFYIPQFLFWVLGFFGIAVETSPIPLLDWVLPGTEIFLFSYFFITVIGLSSMIYAVWIYSLRKISPFDGPRTLAFALAITGYLSTFLNIFPWVIFYMIVVIYTEKKKRES